MLHNFTSMSIDMESFFKQSSPLSKMSTSKDDLPITVFEPFQHSSSSLSTFFQNDDNDDDDYNDCNGYNGYKKCADTICENVSQILLEDDGIQFRFQSQPVERIPHPTPINPHGRNVTIVSQFSTLNDSDLWNDAFRQDLASLLSPEGDAARTREPRTITSKSSSISNNKRDLFSLVNGATSYSPTKTAGTPAPTFSGEHFTNSILSHKSVNVPLLHPVAKKQKLSNDRCVYHNNKEDEMNKHNKDDTANCPLIGNNKLDRRVEKWETKFQELVQYKHIYGDCCVPNHFPDNPKLAQWVKRQRYQYKLKMQGKHSTMTQERIQALEDHGFVWDSHETSWMERWNELKNFHSQKGHSNVPANYAENRTLSIWVKCQRRQYKLYQTGRPSNMTLDRFTKLESLNLDWNPRNL